VILVVLADDIGMAQVGWVPNSSASRGGPDGSSLTPRLDALASQGLILSSHYTSFWCTPSRVSFLSGRLPVHAQTGQDFPETPSAGMPRNMTGLGHLLKRANFSTAAVGKWDAGCATPDHTPQGRGFDASLVSFEHMTDRWTQKIFPGGTACTLIDPTITDLFLNGAPARDLNGTGFSEDLHVAHVRGIIANTSSEQPLFIYYAPHIAHYPLQVPQAALARFDFMADDESACNSTVPYIWPGQTNTSAFRCRAMAAALVNLLDGAIGSIVDALVARGLWEETLMLFSSDNGAPLDVSESGGNNFPLRGSKYSSWEGGVRVPAFVSGGFLPAARRGATEAEPIHISDWYRTLGNLVGVDAHDARAAAAGLPPVDSLDVWPLVSGASPTSPRTEIPVSPNVLISFPWKLLRGPQDWSGRTSQVYPNATSVLPSASPNQWEFCGAGCLFDIVSDPEEYHDVAAANPALVANLSARLDFLRTSFFSNNDTGVDACPPGTPLCGCWAAIHTWGGFFGPYQI
jgi:arylsulfatase I/J